MNVNINFNGKSEVPTKETEDAHTVSDAGMPPSVMEISVSDDDIDENDDHTTASESEHQDIGGPPEWLVQEVAHAAKAQEEVSVSTDTNEAEDGGSGPMP